MSAAAPAPVGALRVLLFICALGASGFGAGAALAAGPELYCRSARAAEFGAQSPTSGALDAAAASAEARLVGAPGDPVDWRALLDVPASPGAQPSPMSLAAYCAAAGESARVSAVPDPASAREFLTAAFQYAEQAHSPSLAGRSAYRLSELAPVGHGVVNARGGAVVELDAAAELGDLARGAASGDPCGLLGGDSGSPVTSLECAAQRAGAAGDWRLATVADLRLARRLTAAADAASQRVALLSARAAQRGASAPRDQAAPDAAAPVQHNGTLSERAAASARDGLKAAENVTDPRDRAQLIGRLLEADLDAGGPPDPAFAAYVADMRSAGSGDPAIEAFAAALAARIALASGDAAGARAMIERSLFEESQRAEPVRLPDWYLLMARADPDQRARYIRSAYLALESVRPLLPARDPLTDESTFALHMRPVFEAAVDVQLAEDGAGGERVAGAQKIFEAYREAEIQSVFGDDCIPPLPPVQARDLRVGEIILYPVLLSDRVELIYAAGGESGGFHRLPANDAFSRAKVALLTDELRTSLISGGDDDWKQASRQLYDLLIAPIQDKLGPQTTLAIVPDGPLRALPFAALTDSSGRFLIQRTRLSIAPALTYSQPGLDHAGRASSVVAAALERQVTVRGAVFPQLAGTGDEARAAVGARSGGVLLENFTRASLINALKDGHVDILHLATHASFGGRSDRSYIVANGEAIPMSELRQILSENRNRGDSLDLLVLSACETAIGDDEASMGLAGAAVQAGSRSALASVWQVNDASTVALMKAFYTDYRSGESKSEALRSAQLSLLGTPQFQDPYYWAAFTLIGGWR
jgi:CHAT domain-containing protein